MFIKNNVKRAKQQKSVMPRGIGTYYFFCSRCGTRYSNDEQCTEWTGITVCSWCLDPEPEMNHAGDWMDYEKVYITDPNTKDVSSFTDRCAVSGGNSVSGFGVAGCMVAGQRNRWGI
jgi:hypothetical protein